MTTLILKDAEVIINGVDLSDHVSQVRLTVSAELQDDTVMGDDTRSRQAGLKDWSAEVTFRQDFDSGSVDDTLYSLVGAAAFTLSVMANKTAGVGSTNPKYNGSVVLEGYPVLGNQIGELAETAVTFQAAGDLTRSTS